MEGLKSILAALDYLGAWLEGKKTKIGAAGLALVGVDQIVHLLPANWDLALSGLFLALMGYGLRSALSRQASADSPPGAQGTDGPRDFLPFKK